MPTNYKEWIEGLLLIAIIIILLMGAFRLFKKEQIFESAEDRDATITMMLTFVSYWGMIYIFHDKISNEFISGLIVGQVSNIGMIVAFHYRIKNGQK